MAAFSSAVRLEFLWSPYTSAPGLKSLPTMVRCRGAPGAATPKP